MLQHTDQSSTASEQAQTSQYVKEQPSGEQQKSAPSQQAALDQQQQQVPHGSSLIAAGLMSRSGSGTSDKALPQARMADPDFAALMTIPAATADPYADTAGSPPVVGFLHASSRSLNYLSHNMHVSHAITTC